jgi:hypothetical protein
MFIVSTYSNYLTVSYREGENLIEKSIPLELSILENSNIKLVDEFKKILYNVLYDIKGLSYKNIPVVFILDPLKVDFRFYKKMKDVSEEDGLNHLFEEIGKNKESLYFSVQKKSPLFSQFVSINKNDLDILDQVSSELGLQVKGIFSYLSLLTKYVNHPGNLIMVTSYLGNIVLSLSEQNSIYFNNSYGSFRDVANIKKLVENLKLFKNNGRNSEIISFNFENPEITSKLNIQEVVFNNDYGYVNPIHALADVTLEIFENEIYTLNYNLLNIVSTESAEVEAKVPLLKYAFMLIFSFIIGGGGYYLSFVNPSLVSNVLGMNSSSSEQPEDVSKAVPGSELTYPRVSVPVESNSKNDVLTGDNIDLTAPTSTLSLPKDKIKVQVLNSTGITGKARTKAELMKSLGYKNVETGDTKPVVEGTVMKVIPTYMSYKDAFLKELITFENLKIEQNTESSPKYDITIILGK